MGSPILFTFVVMATLLQGGRGFLFSSVGGVDRNKIGVEWISRQYADVWQLSTNISWPSPAASLQITDMSREKEFLIRLTQRDSHCATYSSTDVISEEEKTWCQTPLFPFKVEPTDIHTDENFIQLEGLEYGFKYTIMVAVLDRTTNQTSVPACKEEQSPDCYTVTGSRSFCQDRCIPEASPPINLTVVSVGREDSGDGTTAEVTVSWLRPVQHNGDVLYYYVEFVNLDTGLNTHFQDVYENASYSDTTPFLAKQSNVEINSTFSIIVYVFGYFQGGYRRGESTSIQLTVLPEDEAPATTTVQGTTPIVTAPVYKTTDIFSPKTDALSQTRTPAAVRSIPTYVITTIAVGGAVLVSLILSALYCVLKRRQRPKNSNNGVFIPEFDDDDYAVPTNKEENELRYTTGQGLIAKQEFPRHRLTLKEELGRGHFGVVYKAIASGLAGRKDATTVAVKMLKNNATAYQKEDMLREITILQELGDHPNILGILGCCTCEEPYFLITEYMTYGDLLHFLWRSRKKEYQNEDVMYELSEMSFYQIARQIARGMVFLSQNKYVHGDLAARNVLVGDDLMVKITDFGLANDVYLQGWTALPTERLRAVKWVSLETNLQGMCTIESDVWSFGIVLYEIVTKGATPYPSMSAAETIALLKDGYRMEIPEECPMEMYDLMRKCWREKPEERPTFPDLLEAIDQILIKYVDYMDDGVTVDDKMYENDDVIDRTALSLTVDGDVQASKKFLSKTKSQGSGDSAFSEESALTGESNIPSYSTDRTLTPTRIIERSHSPVGEENQEEEEEEDAL